MAVRFSHVILESDYGATEMLARGKVSEPAQLEGYSAYEDYCMDIEDDAVIQVQSDEYLYGEGEIFDATFEELAYFLMRMNDNPNFLANRCSYVDRTEFEINYAPNELFGASFIEL